MLRTRLTETLQIEHPVMLAGMGGVSYHRLVAELFLLPALYRLRLGLNVPAAYRERLAVLLGASRAESSYCRGNNYNCAVTSCAKEA